MAVLMARLMHVGLIRLECAVMNHFLYEKKSAGYSREVFPEMQHRMGTHVHSVCSRGRGSMSLRETQGGRERGSAGREIFS